MVLKDSLGKLLLYSTNFFSNKRTAILILWAVTHFWIIRKHKVDREALKSIYLSINLSTIYQTGQETQ